MIIKYIKGDLFAAPEKYIVHGCNCQGVMGGGVAAIMAKKFPKAYKEYAQLYNDKGLTLGHVQFVDCGTKIIVNMMTQDNYGTKHRMVSYDAVADCFEWLNRMNGQTFAIPKIGAGLGGGNWNIIEAIINESTPNISIYVYDPMLQTFQYKPNKPKHNVENAK